MKDFIDRIRKFRGEPVYEILATTKEYRKYFVVFRETLDGKRYTRNLYYYPIAGYNAKGRPEKRMWKANLDHTPQMWMNHTATEIDMAPVLEKYPNFVYTAAKYGTMWNSEVFRILRIWKEHPEMEIMLNIGYRSLAENRTFLSMDRQKQREAVNFARQQGEKNPNLVDILGAMKCKCTIEEYRKYRLDAHHHSITFKEWKDLNGVSVYDFTNYKKLLTRYFPERLQDDYWTKFKDIADFHKKEARANRQADAIDEARNKEKIQAKQKAYSKAIKKFQDWNCKFEGIDVYVPKTIKEFNRQANVLNQCLVWNNYADLVSNKKAIMVFIRKNNRPLATAELSRRTFKVVQFLGKDNKEPKDNCKKAFSEFQNIFIQKSA